MKGWSPQGKPFTADELRPLYAQGDGEILVVDDFEGGAVVLQNFAEYQRKWVPVMRQFSYWAIQPKGEIQVLWSGDLAVSTFTWVAQARLKDGTVLQPAPSQHATLVWQKRDGRWSIVNEHLTRARPEN
jgi:ketosteroid isomerase-like protein